MDLTSPTVVGGRAALRRIAMGAAFGVVMSALLLTLAVFGGGESGEAAALAAAVFGMPTTMLFDALDWGHYAPQWNAFIAIVLPLNGALFGVVAAAVAHYRRWGLKRWAATFGALWALASAMTLAFGR